MTGEENEAMEELIKILMEINPDVDYLNFDGLMEEGILTSFELVELMVEIQDVFGVMVPAHKITPEHFNSAKAIYEVIQELSEED